eukprot:2649787-Amphidinium_carterae.1
MDEVCVSKDEVGKRTEPKSGSNWGPALPLGLPERFAHKNEVCTSSAASLDSFLGVTDSIKTQ